MASASGGVCCIRSTARSMGVALSSVIGYPPRGKGLAGEGFNAPARVIVPISARCHQAGKSRQSITTVTRPDRRMSPCESRNIMPETREATMRNLDPAQATELSLLVELEARWENLRKALPREPAAGSVTQTLLGVQKAYDAFHSKLVAY